MLDLLAEIPMGQDNPLGDACGSTCILVHGNIVESEFYFRRVGLVLCNAIHPTIDVRGGLHISEGEFLQLFSEKPFNRIQEVTDAHVNDLLDLCLRPQIDHAIAEGIKSNEDFGIGILELMFQLRIRIKRIIHDNDGAYLQNRIVGDNAGNTIGQENRYRIPFLDTEFRQAGSETIHLILELAVCQLIADKHHRCIIGKIFCRFFKIVRHGEFFILDAFRNTFFVGFQPRLTFITDICCHYLLPSLSQFLITGLILRCEKN